MPNIHSSMLEKNPINKNSLKREGKNDHIEN
jgi:hypothetical protein